MKKQKFSDIISSDKKIKEQFGTREYNVSMPKFTEEQLIDFGNYLLSEERKINVSQGVDEKAKNSNMDRFEFIRQRDEELSRVSHADFENWKASQFPEFISLKKEKIDAEFIDGIEITKKYLGKELNNGNPWNEIDKDSDLFMIYLIERINEWQPVSLQYQIELYDKTGIIEWGHNGNFISFEKWKKLQIFKNQLKKLSTSD